MRLPLLILLLASACAAPAVQRQADLGAELAGRTAGAPSECVTASPGASLAVRDSQTLVYQRGRTLWVNRLPDICPGLHGMSRIAIEVHGSRYCRGDRFRADEPGLSIPGPTCLLGRFTPYRRQRLDKRSGLS